jgi:hypothetical protein
VLRQDVGKLALSLGSRPRAAIRPRSDWLFAPGPERVVRHSEAAPLRARSLSSARALASLIEGQSVFRWPWVRIGEVHLHQGRRPGGDAGAEKVSVLGPDGAVEQQGAGQYLPVVGVSLADAC